MGIHEWKYSGEKASFSFYCVKALEIKRRVSAQRILEYLEEDEIQEVKMDMDKNRILQLPNSC